jgi:hypothetical protein
VIVLGTGLKECILSGLLSVDGLKVSVPRTTLPFRNAYLQARALRSAALQDPRCPVRGWWVRRGWVPLQAIVASDCCVCVYDVSVGPHSFTVDL